MKKLTILVLLLGMFIIPSSANSWGPMSMSGGVVAEAPPAECTGYLVCQNFETASTGYDNSESWSEGGPGGNCTTVEAADTTATVLRGTQQLRIDAASTLTDICYTGTSFAAQTVVYLHFKFRADDTGGLFARLYDTNSASCFVLSWTWDGKLTATDGSTAVSTVGHFHVNEAVHIWAYWNRNGNFSAAFSTSTVMPTSGNDFVSSASGTNTTYSVDTIRFVGASSVEYRFDQVYVSTTSIGDVSN